MVENLFQPIERMKTLLRQGWVGKIPIADIESLADHSFGVAYLTLFFSHWETALRQDAKKDYSKLNSDFLCTVALLHDIAESQYMDFDKNIHDLLQEETNAFKIKAEQKGWEKIIEKWVTHEKRLENLCTKYKHLKNEETDFIKLMDQLELHWQTISYFERGLLTKKKGLPFLQSTYRKMLSFKHQFLIIEQLSKENMIRNTFD